jgi:HD-GYP domain-containing protein (c-di-GMP phosphodiesterase class II)
MPIILNNKASIRSLMEVSSHDYYTYTHSVDVSVYAIGFANYLNFSHEEIKDIGYAALMHDIGKSRIPGTIINKNGKLTLEEFERMKKHPIHSHDLLLFYGETNSDILVATLQHHEKKHGNGYPYGLKAHEMHEFSKIIALADVFSALTTKRSYKEAYSSFKALQLMKQYMMQDFDSALFFDFIRFMGSATQSRSSEVSA